jgi:hypothetical protein
MQEVVPNSIEAELTEILKPLWEADLDPVFWPAARAGVESAWAAHVPFAHWLVSVHRSRTIVELGTERGVSYTAFCEAVLREKIDCRCFAVDTWQGDEHTGLYDEEVYADIQRFHDGRYGSFSELIRCHFDKALNYIPDASVDLLHIDGCHSYDAVKHDYETWLPKLTDRGIVLFHDTNVHERNFGVWLLWNELKGTHPSFEFLHGNGLGVLAIGQQRCQKVAALTALSGIRAVTVRERFAALGERWHSEMALQRTMTALDDAKRLAREAGEAREQLQVELADVAKSIDDARAAASKAERLAANMSEQVRTSLARAAEQERQRKAVETATAETATQLGSLREASDDLRRRSDHLQAQLEQAQRERDALLSSTMWQVTWPLRRIGKAIPTPARRQIRRAMRLAWWALTLQLPDRLRERRGVLAQAKQIAASGVLDPEWYFSHYPDAAMTGLDPALHYLLHGAREGHDPGPQFRTQRYLERHSELAGTNINPIIHWLEHGRTPEELDLAEQTVITDEDPYQKWIREYDTIDEQDRLAIRTHIDALSYRPLISVVMPVFNTPEAILRETVESVLNQLYPFWELCIADDASTAPHIWPILQAFAARDGRIKLVRRDTNGNISVATNSALDLATGEFIAFLDHDDLLSEHALYEVAVELKFSFRCGPYLL